MTLCDMLCYVSHITCFKIRFEVAKLPPQTRSPHGCRTANPANVCRVGRPWVGGPGQGPAAGHGFFLGCRGGQPTPGGGRPPRRGQRAPLAAAPSCLGATSPCGAKFWMGWLLMRRASCAWQCMEAELYCRLTPKRSLSF
jgi:hypothetical protein